MDLNTYFWRYVSRHINAITQEDQSINTLTRVNGGDICESFQLRLGNSAYFVKTHHKTPQNMFRKEAHSLNIIARATQSAPKVICEGKCADTSFPILSYIEMHTTGDEKRLGELVAKLHTSTADQFGWIEDNYIGLTLQRNDLMSSWSQFWWDMRLAPQIHMAIEKGYKALNQYQAPLKEAVTTQLSDHKITPTLLHGDLWSGNKGYDTNGKPIIYDPACYYGDPEVDIAMTELFGGFGTVFYESYYQLHPKKSGYTDRKPIYNLYHILNHLNLFGEGYFQESERMIRTILS